MSRFRGIPQDGIPPPKCCRIPRAAGRGRNGSAGQSPTARFADAYLLGKRQTLVTAGTLKFIQPQMQPNSIPA